MTSALIQIPEINPAGHIKPEKIVGGFIWGVCFKLPKPAAQDGYIIQHIIQSERGTQKKNGIVVKTVDRTIQYWEAWEVKKGETEPRQKQTLREFAMTLKQSAPPDGHYNIPVNDIFFRKYPVGAKGNYTINGLAGFYQESLPIDFIVGHELTGAGALKSTITKPPFWTINGLNRNLRFNYTCETESEARDLSKQHLNHNTTVMNMSFADSWLTTN